MKRFALLLFIVLTSTALTFAQTKKGDKVKGYIINKSGKKIEGLVVVGDWASNQLQVKFIKKGTSKKVSYKPNQLKGFAYEETYVDCVGKKAKEWKYYFTRKSDKPSRMFGPTTVFMHQEVADGHFKLFCFYIEVPSNPSKPYKYVFYVEDDKGSFTKVNEDNFKNSTKKIFKDYMALKTRIGDKGFRLKDMDRMVADYNYWKTNRHDPNEYRVAMKN